MSRRARNERGQMMPIYTVVIFALLGLGALLFQVGRAATLRTDAQTAADAAALAGAKELAEQLYSADGSVSAIDEDAIEAAAEDYAEQNGSELTDFALNACGVRVEVKTLAALEGDEAEEVDADGDKAEALAAGAMGSPTTGSPTGVFGAPADGAVPKGLEPAAELAAKHGLQVTSTTGGNHSPGSLHYEGLAIDVSNSSAPTPQMAAFYNEAKEKFDGFLLELFYDPLGGIKNNAEIGAVGNHMDHVHIALSPTKIAGAPDLGSGGGTDGGFFSGSVAGPQLVEYEQVSECALGGIENLVGGLPGYGGFNSDASSQDIAKTICGVGRSLGVSDKIMLAAFETGIVESGMQNVGQDVSDRDSGGVFQQRPSQGWGSVAQVTDVAYAANSFFQGHGTNPGAIETDTSGLSPGQLAQAVQRSAFPLKYDAAEGDARALMEEVGCTADGGD